MGRGPKLIGALAGLRIHKGSRSSCSSLPVALTPCMPIWLTHSLFVSISCYPLLPVFTHFWLPLRSLSQLLHLWTAWDFLFGDLRLVLWPVICHLKPSTWFRILRQGSRVSAGNGYRCPAAGILERVWLEVGSPWFSLVLRWDQSPLQRPGGVGYACNPSLGNMAS